MHTDAAVYRVQGVGYGIVVGFGAFFSILTTVMVRARMVAACCP